MTISEFSQLSLNHGYKFTMYYGDEYYGFIVENHRTNKYYFLSPSALKAYNNKEVNIEALGVLISLENIQSWEPVYSNDFYSPGATEGVDVVSAKKLIILGAGASYDFSFDPKLTDEERPPLTYNLFEDQYDGILSKYPGAKLLAANILLTQDVERFFQQQWENIKTHYDLDLLNKIINTQFYLQHLFQNVSKRCKDIKRTNYGSLISQLGTYASKHKEKVLITSFNYDTLIEHAIESVYGYEYTSINDYIDTTRKFILYKPHGSWNWIRKFKYGGIHNSGFIYNNKPEHFSKQLYREKKSYADIFSQLHANIEINSNLNFEGEDTGNESNYLPQLLIPFTDKDDFVMPIKHRNSLKANMGQLDEILIIGWKGTEAVFLDLLKREFQTKKVKVTVVNASDKSIVENMKESLPYAEWIFENTFSDFMRKCQTQNYIFNDI
jgi:hypothetical protein